MVLGYLCLDEPDAVIKGRDDQALVLAQLLLDVGREEVLGVPVQEAVVPDGESATPNAGQPADRAPPSGLARIRMVRASEQRRALRAVTHVRLQHWVVWIPWSFGGWHDLAYDGIA